MESPRHAILKGLSIICIPLSFSYLLLQHNNNWTIIVATETYLPLGKEVDYKVYIVSGQAFQATEVP